MTKPRRLLAVAAALSVTICGGTAAAQTVMARGVPAGEQVEVILNGKPVGSAPAGETGDATIPFSLRTSLGKAEIDANVYVDACEKTHRIFIVEIGGPLPAEGTCNLRNIPGVYWVRPVNTIVVTNITAAAPSLLLIKGSYAPPLPGHENDAVPPRLFPGGLILFGGGGFFKTRDVTAVACGNLTDCSGRESGLGFTAGAEYRINRYFSAEGSYMQPRTAKVNGGSSNYRFTTEQKTHAFAVTGKVGAPIGIGKVYARAGTIFHQAKIATTQTQDERTVTVDDVPYTFPAGTQTLEVKTDGWGWLFGGGLELWVSPGVALYGEFGYGSLKGADIGGGETKIVDRLTSAVVGLRVHIGR